jgi:ligand-binding SRPBCC domain-containing protein
MRPVCGAAPAKPRVGWLLDEACDHDAVAVRFECVTTLPIPPSAAFDLSLSVPVHLASMARSNERSVGHVTFDAMHLGDQITWRAWHFGIPWRLTSRIIAYDRPHRFTDEQVRGPFHRFHHEHLFEPFDSGTRMTDVVEFEAPVGWLGRLAERMILASYVQDLIGERNRYLAAQATR